MQKSIASAVVALTGAAALAMFVGCGEGNPFGTVKATGSVKLDGEPVEGATVIFQPDSAGKAATAITGAGGVFTLTTGNAGDGAVPGSYKVAVYKTEGVPVEDLSGLSPEEAAMKAKQSEDALMKKYPQGPPPPKDLLPVKFKDPAKSGLTFEVKKEGDNHFDIPLTKGG